MRIVQIVGARPQFVKLAPLSRLIRQKHDELIIHSGQHYDVQMNEVFFQELRLPAPDVNLNIGSASQAVQTAAIMTALEPVLRENSPDLVLVYGDTNTTLAGALTAAKLGLPTAHVEACLRSFNRGMPEEINRVVTDHVSNTLFCPTETALENARAEGLSAKCHLVGDIMVDSMQMGLELASPDSVILRNWQLCPGEYHLLTLHRPTNVDSHETLSAILTNLNGLGSPILFPVHPRTRKTLSRLDAADFPNILCIEPLPYLEMLSVMRGAGMILTDSGGLQKEAYILGKPCVTLRTETEWTETVASGWNLLLPPDIADLAARIAGFSPPRERPDIYGNNVAAKILSILEEYQ